MRIVTANCHIKSATPIQFGAPILTKKLDRESHDDYEKRTWRERAHINAEGKVYIPRMAFTKSLQAAASREGMKIPGKGNATWTKYFASGIMVTNDLVLDMKREDFEEYWLFVPSDGKPGSGTRVWKCFPVVQEWEGIVQYQILDATITREVFKQHLHVAGNFIGVGSFRPQNRGWFGKYRATKIDFEEIEI